jgi:hypothetical protein
MIPEHRSAALFLALSIGLLRAPDSLAALQDDPEVVRTALEQADKLFAEARQIFEKAKAGTSVALFNDAGFKAEDARTKYRAVQELSQGASKQKAAEQLKNVALLLKLINDGRLAIKDPPTQNPTPAPATPAPATPVPPVPAAPLAPPPAMEKRGPVPDAAKLKEAEKTVKEIFKAEYARKGAADRATLAKLLLQSAASQPSPPERWVCLTQAQELASQAGEWEVAWDAVVQAAINFECDGLSMKVSLLAQAAKTVKTPEDAGKFTERYLRIADEAIKGDFLDVAEKAAASGQQMSKRAASVPLTTQATSKAKEVADIKTAYEKSRKARETLAKSPEDPAANHEYGLYLCLSKGQWDLGLPVLAKGPEGPYRTIATRELAAPEGAVEQASLGDFWWEQVDKENGSAKAAVRSRALYWYGRALVGLEGLVRVRTEKRLTDAEVSQYGYIDLLKFIDPAKDSVATQWKLENGVLYSGMNFRSRLQVPYQPPDEYDLTMVFTTTGDGNPLFMGLVAGGTQCHVFIDAWNKSGIDNIDKKGTPLTQGTNFLNYGKGDTFGKDNTVVVAVRKKGITLTVNGKTAFTWEGPLSRLSPNADWSVPNPQALYLGAWDRPLAIRKYALTPISGQGHRLR